VEKKQCIAAKTKHDQVTKEINTYNQTTRSNYLPDHGSNSVQLHSMKEAIFHQCNSGQEDRRSETTTSPSLYDLTISSPVPSTYVRHVFLLMMAKPDPK